MESEKNWLTQIDYKSEFHEGYGAGVGSINTFTYECPCKKGKVEYVKDDIPAFKDKAIYCYCKECNENYQFKGNSDGIEAIKKVNSL